jgi:uncharacterized protein YutE (UPF0331/DUF86 family)
MNPLTRNQRESIEKRIVFIESELKDLEKYKGIDFYIYKEDRRLQRDIERMLENIANASINICKILLVGEDVTIPETYREAFLQLGRVSPINSGIIEKMAEIAKLRNILAHEYLDIRWSIVKKGLSEIGTIKEFLREVRKIL